MPAEPDVLETDDSRIPRRPPTLAIIIGFLEAIGGGVAAVAAVWPAIWGVTFNFRLLLHSENVHAGRNLWYAFTTWYVMILGGFAFIAGMRLLHSDPRGRSWTFRVAVAGWVFVVCQVPWFYADPDLSRAWFSHPHFLLAYAVVIVGTCSFALVAMRSKRVVDYYTTASRG